MLVTESLTKRYPGVTALDQLSLTLEPGVIGLVGANGAGKSTLLKVLLGLISPTSGRAMLFGHDVVREGREVRRRVGYLPEHDCLPPDISAAQFVYHMGRMNGLPAAAARERTAETLRHVGLFEERYREISGYSTGMKQRVKLAQALVHDPLLLLLDEPTNGLDPAGRDEMLDLVRRTGHEFGISIVMASHLLGEIERVCDHLVVIESGQLLKAAPISALTELTGTIAVEVDGDAAWLKAALEAKGLEARVDGGRRLLVVADCEETFDVVRDLVVDLDLGLVRLEHSRHRLEELFRSANAEADAVS